MAPKPHSIILRSTAWFRQLDDRIQKASGLSLQFFLPFLFFVVYIPFVGNPHKPGWWQYPVWIVDILYLGAALLPISTVRRRKKFYADLRDFGRLGALLYTASVFGFALSLFALSSWILHAEQWLKVAPSRTLMVKEWEGFYVWHFLNSIPALDIPKTFGWTETFAQKDFRMGVTILLFKVAVTLPILAVLKAFWLERHSDEAQQGPTDGSVDGKADR